MDLKPLPLCSTLEQYQRQAEELLEGHKAGDPHAIKIFHEKHPRFLDAKIRWLPKNLPDSEIKSAALGLGDAQLAIARWYDFQSWPALAKYVVSVTRDGAPVIQFESAVEAVITGDAAALQSLLRENPELLRARSTR